MRRDRGADAQHDHAHGEDRPATGVMAEPRTRDDERHRRCGQQRRHRDPSRATGRSPAARPQRTGRSSRWRGSAARPATPPSRPQSSTPRTAARRPRRAPWPAQRRGRRAGSRPPRRPTRSSAAGRSRARTSAERRPGRRGPAPSRGCAAGRRRPMAAPQGPAKSSRPRVARVERAKPADRASHGSQQSSTSTATESAGMPARRLEVLRPSSPTAPIAAARTTLGSGRTRTTNPSSSTAASGGRQRRRSPRRPANPSAAARTIATLEPLTADRWVIPVTSMASSRSGGVREVSPMTSPGRRPRASAGSPSVAAANRVRTTSAVRATRPGSSRTVGEPRGVSTATTSSARSSAGASCPTACTRDCQVRPSQVRSAKTRTGDATVGRRCLDPRRGRRRAAGRPRPRSTDVRAVRRPLWGRWTTRPTTSTVARCWARSRTGPASRTLSAAASAVRANEVARAARVTTPHQRDQRPDSVRRRRGPAPDACARRASPHHGQSTRPPPEPRRRPRRSGSAPTRAAAPPRSRRSGPEPAGVRRPVGSSTRGPARPHRALPRRTTAQPARPGAATATGRAAGRRIRPSPWGGSARAACRRSR